MNVFTGFRGAENVEWTRLASGLGRAAAERFLPAEAALINADGSSLTRRHNAAKVLFVQHRPRHGRIQPADHCEMLTVRGDITGCEEAPASSREGTHGTSRQVAAGFASSPVPVAKPRILANAPTPRRVGSFARTRESGDSALGSPARENHVPFSKGIRPRLGLLHPFGNGKVTFLHFHRPFHKGLLPLFLSCIPLLVRTLSFQKWLIPFYSGSYDLLPWQVRFSKGTHKLIGGHDPFLDGNCGFINGIVPLGKESNPLLKMPHPFSKGITARRDSVAPRSLRHRPARRGSVPGWRCARAGRPRHSARLCRMVAARCFRVPTGRGVAAMSGWGVILDPGTTAICRRSLILSPVLHPPQLSGLPSFSTLHYETSDLLPTSDQ